MVIVSAALAALLIALTCLFWYVHAVVPYGLSHALPFIHNCRGNANFNVTVTRGNLGEQMDRGELTPV